MSIKVVWRLSSRSFKNITIHVKDTSITWMHILTWSDHDLERKWIIAWNDIQIINWRRCNLQLLAWALVKQDNVISNLCHYYLWWDYIFFCKLGALIPVLNWSCIIIWTWWTRICSWFSLCQDSYMWATKKQFWVSEQYDWWRMYGDVCGLCYLVSQLWKSACPVYTSADLIHF